jgi:hypothetical protein
MSDNQVLVESLINGIEFKDTRLDSLLRTISSDLYGLNRQINPPTVQSSNLNPGGNVVIVTPPSGFMASVINDSIRLVWNTVSTHPYIYEVKIGASYNTAVIILTAHTFDADIDPHTNSIVTGNTYTFWLTAIDDFGNRSTPVSAVIVIPVIGAPTITPTILQNYAILNWTIPVSIFTIDHYLVYRNGAVYGTSHGTFFTIFELSAGTYTYSVQAVDIVGNLGTPSPTITLTLTAPTDFITQGTILSTFNGTKVNTFLEGTRLIAPVFPTETWNDHFAVNNVWANIAAQIAAGYSIYAEPSKNTGTYTETFDFGAAFDNVIVSLNYNTVSIVGSVSINFTIAVSTDNITFDTPQAGTTRFATAVRYAKVVATFTPSPTDKSLVYFFNFTCNLNVHQETDSNNVTAVSTDAGGTVVTFNKAFKGINSITALVKQTATRYAVVDFNYATVNPTTFKILVFDNAGVRKTETVAWIAKGIL